MENVIGYSHLLAVVIAAICHPTIKLTNIMPLIMSLFTTYINLYILFFHSLFRT